MPISDPPLAAHELPLLLVTFLWDLTSLYLNLQVPPAELRCQLFLINTSRSGPSFLLPFSSFISLPFAL